MTPGESTDSGRVAALLGEHGLLFSASNLRAGEVDRPSRIVCTCGHDCGLASDDAAYDDHRAHVAAVLVEAGVGFVAQAKAWGVNEGVRLAADMVRDHVLSETGVRIADFLIARADRAKPGRRFDRAAREATS